jgi:hypothetical protein
VADRALLIVALEGALAALRAETDEAAPTTGRRRFYSASSLPPGAASWRAALETCARHGIPKVRAGRSNLIPAAEWDAWLEGRARGERPAVTEGDASTLRRLGVVIGGRR